MPEPLLVTAVVGSYSMPGWLERVKNDYLLRRISRHDLDEIHDLAVKAAIKDQEVAGVDVITDGELRRENMIDHFAVRLPGVSIDHASKKFYYDFYDSVVRARMPTAALGLVEEYRFLRRFTDRRTKISVTGPHSLVKRIRNEHYPSEEAFALDIARVMNLELSELVKAGATDIQVDEPYYSGFPEDLPWAIAAVNALVAGIDARIGLHICYGNRYGKPAWEGSYRYLFPGILEARVAQLTLEFGRRGEEDVRLFKEYDPPFTLGLGVIDVKTHDVESPAVVAERIRKALEVVAADRLAVNPDCGLLHLPREVAFAKLCSMVEGTRLVRKELGGVSNALREALASGRFCYVVELVASALKREAQVLEVASSLARLPAVAAGSVTSYAGGAIGHDPLRVGAAARARGLAPNIHLTCVSQDRHGLRKTLEDLSALGIENVFALTGDYPAAGEPGAPPPVFDLDSVQLVHLIDDLRREGMPFHVSVAVSPFKYTEADCVYQYVKLEKKIAAGADLAITQVGWDAEKFRELKRYLDERGLRIPVLGNVYVLTKGAAERMATGKPPGCWVSPALLEVVRAEQASPDRGRRARLERSARTAAVLRGLGYAGAYIGGTHDADQVQWIIRRAEELAPDWERLADELRFGDPDGFYFFHVRRTVATGRPVVTRTGGGRSRQPLAPRLLDGLGRVLPVTRDTWLRRALARAAAWVDRRPRLARAVERVELAVKQPLFGCQACGNCVLGAMEYVCPQTCPKQMRNGPCGGTQSGRCEVVDQPCIWVPVYERAQAAGRPESLRVYVPPPDRALRGTSSWINYFLDRDRRPLTPDT